MVLLSNVHDPVVELSVAVSNEKSAARSIERGGLFLGGLLLGDLVTPRFRVLFSLTVRFDYADL